MRRTTTTTRAKIIIRLSACAAGYLYDLIRRLCLCVSTATGAGRHNSMVQVMPVLCFFMAVTSLLTQLGVLQVVVGAIGSVLSIITRVTKAETFVSIAAVFLGPVSCEII